MPQQLLHQEKKNDMSIGSDEPAKNIKNDIQAKSLANEVKFITANELFTSTVINYLPSFM